MQTLRLIGNILAAVLIACCITSCDDDDEKIGGGSQLEKLIKQIAVNDYTYDFTYEGKKLKTITPGPKPQLFGYYDFDYKGDTVVLMEDSKRYAFEVNGEGYFVFMNKEDSSGYGKKNEIQEYIYDHNGYLTKTILINSANAYSLYYEHERKYTYSGNNMTNMVTTEPHRIINSETGEYLSDGYERVCDYTDIENKSHLSFSYSNFLSSEHLDMVATTGRFYGKASKNLVSKIEIIYSSDCIAVANYTYELDNDGYVKKMTETTKFADKISSCVYQFSYY